MESARLRLIILGALRGLISPGYKNGINSVIREELLLRALSREIDGEAFIQRGIVESTVISVTDPSRRPMSYRKAISFLLQGNAMMKLHPQRSLREIHLSDSEQQEIRKASALLKILKRTDFSDKMLAMLKAT